MLPVKVKPKLLIPAAAGSLTAAGCSISLVGWIDCFHAELWPTGFEGQALLGNAIALILFLSLLFGFPGGLIIALIASRTIKVSSFIWASPISAFIGAALGILLVYGLAYAAWPAKYVLGDIIILVAAISIAAGGASCAFFLARSCRSLRAS